jgi:hypothetical protein
LRGKPSQLNNFLAELTLVNNVTLARYPALQGGELPYITNMDTPDKKELRKTFHEKSSY